MTRFKVILLTALGALAMSLVAASGAQADEYSCTFTGAAGPVTAYDDPNELFPIETGVEAIVGSGMTANEGDINNDEGDGAGGNVLTDTDDGDGDLEGSGEDGEYEFASTSTECLYVDDETPANSGVFGATIESTGEYNNYVCGTGWAVDDDMNTVDGSVETTDVDLLTPDPANPERPDLTQAMDGDIIDADYRIDFTDGQGALDIRDADNDQGESGTGAGVVSIEPTTGNCVTTDVTAFSVAGSFAGATSP